MLRATDALELVATPRRDHPHDSDVQSFCSLSRRLRVNAIPGSLSRRRRSFRVVRLSSCFG